MAELDAEGDRVQQGPRSVIGEFTAIDGVRYRFVYETRGDYFRSDGKGVIEGISFAGIVRA